MAQEKTCTVIGGCGFLGQHLVEGLLDKGYSVKVFDLKQTFDNKEVQFFLGDLCKREELLPALSGSQTVFHCATPSPLNDNREIFEKVNCMGTKVVLDCCKEAGVKVIECTAYLHSELKVLPAELLVCQGSAPGLWKLILTSSASVIYEGTDLQNGREELGYADNPMNAYVESKIKQEEEILEANNPSEDFCTIALRPHGIFGPRDPHFIPTLVNMAKRGGTLFKIGKGTNKVDFTYVENVVHGHILAAEKLKPKSRVTGRAYNITNAEPVPFWDFIGRVLTGLNYSAPKISLPYALVFYIALFLQLLCNILKPIIEIKPSLTPVKVMLSATVHYYSIKNAAKDLGYQPPISLDEGLQKTLESFNHLKRS